METSDQYDIPIVDRESGLDFEYLSLNIVGKQTPSGVLNLYEYFTDFNEYTSKKFNEQIDWFTKTLPSLHRLQAYKPEYTEKYMKELDVKLSACKLDDNTDLCAATIEASTNFWVHRKTPKKAFKNLRTLQLLLETKNLEATKTYVEKNWYSKKVPKASQKDDIVPLDDLILTVKIYKPYITDKEKKNEYRIEPRVSQNVEILGSQTLDKLRDIIVCSNDNYKEWDFSVAANGESVAQAKELYKSAFFYLEDTFYNDMRDPTNIDYSEVIRYWNRPDNPYRNKMTAKMEETTFSQLGINLGYPYLYQHQGSCEHLVVFTSMRIIGFHDMRRSVCYPRYSIPYRVTNINCYMCGIYPASWLTRDNDLPHDPCLFCSHCYRSFNYDKKGKKVGEFTSHPFLQDTPLPDKDIISCYNPILQELENREKQERKYNKFPPNTKPTAKSKSKPSKNNEEVSEEDTATPDTLVSSEPAVTFVTLRKRCGRRRYSEGSVDLVQPGDSHPALALANATGYDDIGLLPNDDDALGGGPKRRYKRKQKTCMVASNANQQTADYNDNEHALTRKFYKHLDHSLNSLPPYKGRNRRTKKEAKKCDKCCNTTQKPQENIRKSKRIAMERFAKSVCTCSQKTTNKKKAQSNKKSNSNVSTEASISNTASNTVLDPLTTEFLDSKSGTLSSTYLHKIKTFHLTEKLDTSSKNDSSSDVLETSALNTQINEVTGNTSEQEADLNEEFHIKPEIIENVTRIDPSTSDENSATVGIPKQEFYIMEIVNGENVLYPI